MRQPKDLPLFDWAEAQGEEVRQELPPLWGVDEIYARADKLLLQTLKEDRRIERKPARIHAEPLAEYFSMWANTSPDGGLVAVGVNDKGMIDGCHGLDTVNLNKLEQAGYIYCPESRYETKRVPVKLDDGTDSFILLIRVHYHATRVVETVSGKVFIRIGSSKIELKTDEEKQQLRTDKGEVRLEQEPCGLSYPADFDTDLIQRWAAAVRKTRRLSNDLADEKIMEVLHLGKRKDGKFVPNIACALIFAIDPEQIIPGCKIRFLRFDGIEEGQGAKFNAVKDEW